MTTARKVALLKRTYALAQQRGWTPHELDRVPDATAPAAAWRAFLTTHTYIPTLIWTDDPAIARWGKRMGKRHADLLRLMSGLQREDALFAYLAKHLPEAPKVAA